MRGGFYETNPPTLKKEEAYREVAALRDDGQVSLFRIVTPIVMHLPHRGWLLLSGVVTLLLGVYI